MSKVSFRARAIDANKLMPVFVADELPDLSEYAAINRAVPAMPTGMEKDEEMELHLQAAINAQQASLSVAGSSRSSPSSPVPSSTSELVDGDTTSSSSSLSRRQQRNSSHQQQQQGAALASSNHHVIPTPSVTSNPRYADDSCYPNSYRVPRQLIKVQAALNLEPEIPDYDLDSDDERWLSAVNEQRRGWPADSITPEQFETIVDRLEKASERVVCKLDEIKSMLHLDDQTVQDVYDYWLNKRIQQTRLGQALIPRVKGERRDGTTSVNPYVAFRRRAEKIQTRRNRKNDEDSYEKILKLSHDLRKAVTLLEMVKRREKSKRELVNLNVEIFEKRFRMSDFSDEIYNQVLTDAKPSFQFLAKNELQRRSKKERRRKLRQLNLGHGGSSVGGSSDVSCSSPCSDEGLVSRAWLAQNAEQWHRSPVFPLSPTSGRRHHPALSPMQQRLVAMNAAAGRSALASSSVGAGSLDGKYGFRRKKGCTYYAPAPLLRKTVADETTSGVGLKQEVVGALTSAGFRNAMLRSAGNGRLTNAGLLRRRVGRGGRINFDRLSLLPTAGTFCAVCNERLTSNNSDNRRPSSRAKTEESSSSELISSVILPNLLSSATATASIANRCCSCGQPLTKAASHSVSDTGRLLPSSYSSAVNVNQPSTSTFAQQHFSTHFRPCDLSASSGYECSSADVDNSRLLAERRLVDIGGSSASSSTLQSEAPRLLAEYAGERIGVRVGVSSLHYNGHRERMLSAGLLLPGASRVYEPSGGGALPSGSREICRDEAYHSTAAVMLEPRFWSIYGRRIEQMEQQRQQRAAAAAVDAIEQQQPSVVNGAPERTALHLSSIVGTQSSQINAGGGGVGFLLVERSSSVPYSPDGNGCPAPSDGPRSAPNLSTAPDSAVLQLNYPLPTPSPSPTSSRGSVPGVNTTSVVATTTTPEEIAALSAVVPVKSAPDSNSNGKNKPATAIARVAPTQIRAPCNGSSAVTGGDELKKTVVNGPPPTTPQTRENRVRYQPPQPRQR